MSAPQSIRPAQLAVHRRPGRGNLSDAAAVYSSDNNRKAKFYRLTRAGRKQIERDTRQWETTSAIMTRFLAPSEKP